MGGEKRMQTKDLRHNDFQKHLRLSES